MGESDNLQSSIACATGNTNCKLLAELEHGFDYFDSSVFPQLLRLKLSFYGKKLLNIGIALIVMESSFDLADIS